MVQFLHSQDIIHTNLNPNNIFLRNKDPADMCFLELYHCSWDPKRILPHLNLGSEFDDNVSLYDVRTRNKYFISPEQVGIGQELAELVLKRNGKIEANSYDIQEFMLIKKYAKQKKINKQCDIYSLGAILFKLLLGRAPSVQIANFIAEHRLHEQKTDSNVYDVPYFFKDYILSNDMCQIIVKLLHKHQQHRYQTLEAVKHDLLRAQENILETPVILRQIVGHPILPNEDFGQHNIPKHINFKNSQMNEFSLKYLAKFVYEHRVEQLAINGGYMPLHSIKTNQLIQLNLRDAGLYSEDLFILSQYLIHN